MNPRIILVGAGPFVLPIFHKLFNSSIRIKALVTQADAARDRGKKIKSQEVADAAESCGIPVLKPSNINTIADELKEVNADLLLTASYGQFIKRTVREACPFKSFNLHPSLLPLYRGATPVNATLKEGRHHTGVTLYQMESKMDAGPIAAQVTTDIFPNETAGELLLRLADIAGELAIATLPLIVNGTITLREQQHENASFCHKLSKQDALIDWTLTATDIHNRLRAHHPWPGSYCHYQGKRLTLYDSEIVEVSKKLPQSAGTLLDVSKQGVTVNCGEGSILFKSFQLPGKKKLDAATFLNGNKLQAGECFQ